MTNQLKTALLASAAALALAAPASAANTNQVCAAGMTPCVYDQAGDALGVFQTQGILNRTIGGTWYFVGYDEAGYTVDLTLLFASKDCSGQALMSSGYIGPDNKTPVAPAPPTWAQWDGTSFWSGVGPSEVITAQSQVCYGAACDGNTTLIGVCQPYTTVIGWGWPAFAPAKVIGTPILRTSHLGVACGGSTGVACVTVK